MTTMTTVLPEAEVCARVALACAGLSGNRHINHAITTAGSATQLVADCWDGNPGQLEPVLAHRVRSLGRPSAVATVMRIANTLGLEVLTPTHPLWPAGLNSLGAAAPLVLWADGDLGVALDRPVGVCGNLRPSAQLAHAVLDMVTRIADAGWIVLTSANRGVDELARKATVAMGGHHVTVTATARPAAGEHETVISENPPGLPVVIASAIRVPVLVAALSDRLVVGGADAGTPAMRAGIAAHALGRPLGRLAPDSLGDCVDVQLVSTLRDVERLI